MEPENNGRVEPEPGKKKRKRDKKEQRPFDFSKHSRRHIALQIVYLGWDYHGFAVQETTDKTVEAALFPSFIQTRLIESRETSCYHRCGRTDKGVSAFGQVISITFRSSLCTGLGVIRPGEVTQAPPTCTCGKDCSDEKELPYSRMLNRALPPEMRVLAWAPAHIGFSARFDCASRMYHYTFPAPEGLVNFDAMRSAASKFVGEHDFRNFCRADQTRAGQSFNRDIFSTDVTQVSSASHKSPPFGKFEVIGSSFLWHQVRCIMTILLAVGRNEEPPEVVETLLDPVKMPDKPSYAMAADFPLVLAHCQYKNTDLKWREDPVELARLAEHFEKMWTTFAVQTSIIGDLITNLRQRSGTTSSIWSGSLKAFLPPGQPRNPRSLLTHFTTRGQKRAVEKDDSAESDSEQVAAKKSAVCCSDDQQS